MQDWTDPMDYSSRKASAHCWFPGRPEQGKASNCSVAQPAGSAPGPASPSQLGLRVPCKRSPWGASLFLPAAVLNSGHCIKNSVCILGGHRDMPFKLQGQRPESSPALDEAPGSQAGAAAGSAALRGSVRPSCQGR